MLNITSFSTYCVKADYYAEFIPGISTVTNLIDLFLKYAIRPCLSQATLRKSHYFTYLETRPLPRCLVLLIPVLGNLLIGFVEFSCAKKIAELEKRAKESTDETRAFYFYRQAADLGSPEANYKYGQHILSMPTESENKNRYLAFCYIRNAAMWGHPEAQETLARHTT